MSNIDNDILYEAQYSASHILVAAESNKILELGDENYRFLDYEFTDNKNFKFDGKSIPEYLDEVRDSNPKEDGSFSVISNYNIKRRTDKDPDSIKDGQIIIDFIRGRNNPLVYIKQDGVFYQKAPSFEARFEVNNELDSCIEGFGCSDVKLAENNSYPAANGNSFKDAGRAA